MTWALVVNSVPVIVTGRLGTIGDLREPAPLYKGVAMPEVIRVEEFDRIVGIIGRFSDDAELEDTSAALGHEFSRRTLRRRLVDLMAQARIAGRRERKAFKYRCVSSTGTLEATLPGIEIEGHGDIYFPTSLLRDVFVWAYQRSCQQCVAVRSQLVPPDTFRLCYRTALAVAVSAIMRGRLPATREVHASYRRTRRSGRFCQTRIGGLQEHARRKFHPLWPSAAGIRCLDATDGKHMMQLRIGAPNCRNLEEAPHQIRRTSHTLRVAPI